MSLVSTDAYAVESDSVCAVVRTDDPGAEMYWVTVSLSNGQTVNFRFPSSDECQKFYKTLVDAMNQ